MKKIENYIVAIALAATSLTITGCNSAKASTPAPAPRPAPAPIVAPSPVSTSKQVSLADIPVGLKREFLSDKGDLRQVAEIALATSDMGDHKLAASMFMQAYKDFSSPDKRLERSLLAAAICEYFQAGMIEAVRDALKELDTYRTSVYNNFDDDATIAAIRKIVK